MCARPLLAIAGRVNALLLAALDRLARSIARFLRLEPKVLEDDPQAAICTARC